MRKLAVVILLLTSAAVAQQRRVAPAPLPAPTPGVPADRVFYMRAPVGKWWKNSQLVQKLGVNDSQVQQIEQIFQEHRMRLIDIHANLEREETRLEPMIEAYNADENAVIAQIDKIAAARAELEKANARMMLNIRRVLTADQWQKLQAEVPQHLGPGPVRFRMHMPAPPPPPPAGGPSEDNL